MTEGGWVAGWYLLRQAGNISSGANIPGRGSQEGGGDFEDVEGS